MATSIGKSASLTLTATRLLLLEKNQRFFSTCQICYKNTWHVYAKPSRLREIYNAKVDINKLTSKGGDVENIVIPDKIERSPTAVLEALASTVKNNVNQPVYMSIDDPNLYVSSDRQKKHMMAAMDSGHNAAKMMISLAPDYFTQLWEEPLPDSYRDLNAGYKFNDPSEEALLERIAKLDVQGAVTVYEALMKSKNELSQETQEKLLELLTVLNCKNQEPVSDLTTYVNPAPLTKHVPFPVCTWKKDNMAEEVFKSLPTKTARAYCNMIRGMAANYDKQGALDMFNEMKAANLKADVYTYNMLLSLASIEISAMDEAAQFIEMVLKDMVASEVKPNVETFNSVLINCRRVSKWSGTKNYTLSVLSEMKACGIEPNLSTFTEVIKVFFYHKDKTSSNPVLFEKILDELEGKEFKCTTENDILFFRTAMLAICSHFPDSRLALKLHRIVKTGKNSDLLGHRQLQYTYYNDLFSVVASLEHIDVVMDLYTSVVPHIFFPSSVLYKALFESIDMYDCHHYIPQLVADIQDSTMFSNEDLVEVLTCIMAKQKQEPKLQGQLCDVASSIISSWMETRVKIFRTKTHMDGSVIGRLMIVFFNGDQPKKSWELFQLYQNNAELRSRDPSEESLTRLAEYLISEEDYSSTKKVLNQMHQLEYAGVSPLIEKVLLTFNPSDQERNYLQGLTVESASSSSSSSSDSASDSE